MIKKGRSFKKVVSCLAVSMCLLTSGLTVGAYEADTTPPSAPSAIYFNNNCNQRTIDWPDCTDNVKVAGYTVSIYDATNKKYSTQKVYASECTLGPVTSEYYVYVSAFDDAGNKSASTYIRIPAQQ